MPTDQSDPTQDGAVEADGGVLAEPFATFRRWLPLPDPTALYAVLGAVAEEAGVLVGDVSHAPSHLRVASVRGGAHAVQVQRWLGHHSPAFTLSVYVHLLDDDPGGPPGRSKVNSARRPRRVRRSRRRG